MDIWDLFMGTCVSILALCVIAPIVKIISIAVNEAREDREAEERAAAQEEARRREKSRIEAQQAKEKAAIEAEKEAKRRAAAAKKAEQKRKAEERAAAIQAKEQEKARKQAEKLEAARQLAEYQERALQAERELRTLRRANIPAQPQPAPAPQEAPAKPAPQPAAVSLAQFAAMIAASAQEEAPRLCSISASAECSSGGYRVFGTVNASVCPGSFEPSARFMLGSYPIFDYYLKHEFLAHDLDIDVFLHLLDENGKCQNMTADAHYTIRADALYNAMYAA